MELIVHGGVLLTRSLNSYWAGDHGYHLQHKRLIRSWYHTCLSLLYVFVHVPVSWASVC